MGTVIGFPEVGRGERGGRLVAMRAEPATVIILPVIRIERYTDEPVVRGSGSGRSQRRRRRRRATRTKASA